MRFTMPMADKKKLAATIAPIVNQAMTNIAQSITTAFAEQMQEFNNSLTDAEKKLVEKERVIDFVEKENHKLADRIQNLATELTETKDKWKETAEDLNTTIAELNAKDAAVAVLKSVHEDQQKRIEELEAQLRDAAAAAVPAVDGGAPIPAEQPAVPIEAPKADGKVRHAEMDFIKTILMEGDACYINGPAGSGKSFICEQIAEEMELPFYVSSQVTQEYQIEGFVDAHGVYQSVPFYEAFSGGGIFVLEEMDASSPDVLVKINTALANGYATFPGKGLVRMHKDFHCVATGNTNGAGADSRYTGRMQLDASTIDRFEFRTVDYDERIELTCANGNIDLVNFIHDVRRAIEKCGADVPFAISYRGITKLEKYEKIFGLKEAMKQSIVKGLDRDNVAMIFNNLDNKRSRYAKALNVWGNYEEERAIA